MTFKHTIDFSNKPVCNIKYRNRSRLNLTFVNQDKKGDIFINSTSNDELFEADIYEITQSNIIQHTSNKLVHISLHKKKTSTISSRRVNVHLNDGHEIKIHENEVVMGIMDVFCFYKWYGERQELITIRQNIDPHYRDGFAIYHLLGNKTLQKYYENGEIKDIKVKNDTVSVTFKNDEVKVFQPEFINFLDLDRNVIVATSSNFKNEEIIEYCANKLASIGITKDDLKTGFYTIGSVEEFRAGRNDKFVVGVLKGVN